MKMLFVSTVDVGNPVEVMFPPLGLAYIASYLRNRLPGADIRIIYDRVEQEIREFNPDILAISSVSQNFHAAKQYAKTGKAYGLPVIVGGAHITSIPSTMTEHMDIAVLGEGEETMSEIIRSVQDSGYSMSSLREVPGIAYRENGTINFSPPRREITPLDSIPFPARDLLPIPRNGIVHLFSSRGCPYKCRFCASTHFWNKLRFFSAEYVMEEIDNVVARYHPVSIGFYDDLFIASKKRLFEIVELVMRKGYHKKLEFVLNGRANLITEEVAAALKKMNVVRVNMGLESGSKETLAFLKGETASVEMNGRAVELLENLGISTHGTFIIGCPGEAEKDIMQTEAFIRKSRLSSFEVYLLTPLPGTPIWDLALKKGLVDNDMDWRKLMQQPRRGNGSKILMADQVPPERLYEYYMRLQKLKKLRTLSSRIKTALKNPVRLVPAIRKKMALRFRR